MNMKAEHVGNLNLYLSTWNTTESRLETMVRNSTGTPVVDPNFIEGTTGELVSIYKISLWISNPGNPSGGTDSEWESLVGGTQGNALETTYTFGYVTPTLGESDADITAAKLPYYFAEKLTGASDDYDHSKEVISSSTEPNVHKYTTPSVKTLFDAGAVDNTHAYQVGYLYLRVEGTGVDHDRNTTYKGSVVATAPDLA